MKIASPKSLWGCTVCNFAEFPQLPPKNVRRIFFFMQNRQFRINCHLKILRRIVSASAFSKH